VGAIFGPAATADQRRAKTQSGASATHRLVRPIRTHAPIARSLSFLLSCNAEHEPWPSIYRRLGERGVETDATPSPIKLLAPPVRFRGEGWVWAGRRLEFIGGLRRRDGDVVKSAGNVNSDSIV
jgi:hypothetical protein